jgi:hypothetical protein
LNRNASHSPVPCPVSRGRAVIILFALASTIATAQPITSVDAIPAVERPADHFYGAIAGKKRVEVRWEVSPNAVPLGESCTLTLVVANAVNPHELTRPPLLDFAPFRDLLSSVEDLTAEPNAAGEVTFTYHVTPRNEGVFSIPELVFRYYQPNAPSGRRALTTHATKVPFTVTKPAAVKGSPLVAPPEFFATRTDGTFTRSGGPGLWAWVVLFAGGVTAGVAWVFGWRRMNPTAARLSAIRRHRAVRVALDRLRQPQLSAEQVGVTLRNYLIARHGLAFTAQTPAEVATGLAEVGVPPERAAEAESLLRACDAARFAGGAEAGVSAKAVADLIERWEGVQANGAT